MIHPTAIIGPSTTIPGDCEIGPYSILEDEVTLGAGCRIGPHVVLRKGTTLGEGVVVHAGAVLGGEPQDIGFDESIQSGVLVGPHTQIREMVTVSRSSKEGGQTVIGERCFLMAACHVAHDCALGERVVLANAALLAGHVQVGRFSFIGGSAGIHQFCRIGESVMLGGNAAITLDLPPFTMVADRNRLAGLNLVGLRRRGFSREAIADVKNCFSNVYRSGGNPRAAAAAAVEQQVAKTEEGSSFLRFFADGNRGFARPGRHED
ncbi:MAG: acyl-ACP--UDP-N-acetylglucosamine O-acyltransferase [Opitutales bacterium]